MKEQPKLHDLLWEMGSGQKHSSEASKIWAVTAEIDLFRSNSCGMYDKINKLEHLSKCL